MIDDDHSLDKQRIAWWRASSRDPISTFPARARSARSPRGGFAVADPAIGKWLSDDRWC